MKTAIRAKAEQSLDQKKDFELFDNDGIIPIEEQRRICNALSDAGIDFHEDLWDLTHLLARNIGFKSEKEFNFKDQGARKYILGHMKNYVKYAVGKRIIEESVEPGSIRDCLKSLRFFSAFLARLHCTIKGIDRELLLKYENRVFAEQSSTLTTSTRLRTVYLFLETIGIATGWQPPKIKHDYHTVGRYLLNNKEKMPPEEVIMQINALAGQLSETVNRKLDENAPVSVLDIFDMFTLGELIIQVGTFSRVNEVLCLNVECECFGDDGEYALIMYTEKPTRRDIKTVAPQYINTVKKVIATIRRMTNIPREYVKLWEDKGETQYILKGQKLSESLFCSVSLRRSTKMMLNKEVLSAMLKAEKMTRSKFRKMLGNSGAWCLYKQTKRNRGRKQIKVVNEQVDVMELCENVFEKGKLFNEALLRYCLRRITDKFNITYNGNPYYLNTHQLRHYTTTKMLNNGADLAMTDKVHGRQTKGQSSVYDHPTDDDVKHRAGDMDNSLSIRMVNEIDTSSFIRKPVEIDYDMRDDVFKLMESGLILGGAAKAYKKICCQHKSGAMTEAEFEYMKWQIMPMISKPPLLDIGLCTHSYYEHPCPSHYNCLLDDYGRVCKSLSPVVHPNSLQVYEKVIKELEFTLEIARKKDHDEYGKRWVENIEKKITNARVIMQDITKQVDYVKQGEIADGSVQEN